MKILIHASIPPCKTAQPVLIDTKDILFVAGWQESSRIYLRTLLQNGNKETHPMFLDADEDLQYFEKFES